ncbi:hypothetical protein RUM44_004916 [Polyplax serrata]|uniref:Uncharacterized protein n=1 Tax=Polyplax serrata TaxID=468196 RepID=A0ABR1B486_POLSC
MLECIENGGAFCTYQEGNLTSDGNVYTLPSDLFLRVGIGSDVSVTGNQDKFKKKSEIRSNMEAVENQGKSAVT